MFHTMSLLRTDRALFMLDLWKELAPLTSGTLTSDLSGLPHILIGSALLTFVLRLG